MARMPNPSENPFNDACVAYAEVTVHDCREEVKVTRLAYDNGFHETNRRHRASRYPVVILFERIPRTQYRPTIPLATSVMKVFAPDSMPETGRAFFGLDREGHWRVYHLTFIVDGHPDLRKSPPPPLVYEGSPGDGTLVEPPEHPTHWTYVFPVEEVKPEPPWAVKLRGLLAQVYSHGVDGGMRRAIDSCVDKTIRGIEEG